MNEIEKLLKDKLASQGIDKAWLDTHLEVLTDDEDEEDCQLEGIKKVNDKIDSMNEKLDNYLDKTSRAK
jgi:hypothetical protein